jgi:YYY domain-containing protein
VVSATGVLPFGRGTIMIAWLVVAAIGAVAVRGRAAEMAVMLVSRWRWIAGAETLFLVAFAAMVWLRSHNAGFWTPGGGDETAFSSAIFNAAARSTSFPPFDPWLSGGQLHLPYWGMMPWVLLTRLTGVVPASAHTLAFAGIFAMLVITTWAVAAAMVARISRSIMRAGWLALVAPLLIGISGTLDVVARAGRGAWGFPARPESWPDGAGIGDVLYGLGNVLTRSPLLPPSFADSTPGSGEAVPFTTPIAGLLSGPLSPAVTSLPLVALALAIASGIVLLSEGRSSPRRYAGLVILGGIVAGTMSASATWGLVVTGLIIAAAIVIRLLHTRSWDEPWPLVRDMALHTGAVVGIAAIASLPFHLEFVVTGRNAIAGSSLSLRELSLTGGGMLLAIGIYLLAGVARVLQAARDEGSIGQAAALVTAGIGAGGMVVAWWLDNTLVLLMIMMLLLVVALWQRQDEPMHLLVLTFGGAGIGLLLYAPLAPMPANPFGEAAARDMTTATWLFLGMATAAIVAWLASVLPDRPDATGQAGSLALIAVSTIVLAGMLAGPVMVASTSVHSAKLRSLDATAFLATTDDPQANAADREAARWLMDNVEGLPVLLEAPGWDHQYGGRVSAMTGLPSVLGWPTPERMMRPGWDQVVTQRQDAAHRIYGSLGAFEGIEPLLEQYDVRLIYIGPLERRTYDEMALRKFERAAAEGRLEVLYDDGAVVIYEYGGSGAEREEGQS